MIQPTNKEGTTQPKRYKSIMYAIFCCGHRPQKDESDKYRVIVGGDWLDYDGYTSVKVGAKYTVGNIGNIYTNT